MVLQLCIRSIGLTDIACKLVWIQNISPSIPSKWYLNTPVMKVSVANTR